MVFRSRLTRSPLDRALTVLSRHGSALAAVALLTGAASCGHAAAPRGLPPVLQAHVRGAVSVDFSAPALLAVSVADGTSRKDFVIFASQSDSGARGITILITHVGGSPPLGVSDVQRPAQTLTGLSGFHLLFFLEPDAFQEQYASEGGSVTITESSSSYIAGSFRVIANRYCRRVGLQVDGSCDPRVVSPTSPSVTIQGEFRARRGGRTPSD